MDEARQALWQQADAVFGQLLELAPDQRGAALVAMAIEPDLRARVRRLLDAYAEGEGPLDHPGALPLPAEVPNALAGRRLGRWRLEDEIGRGGMSVVYRAHAVEGPEGQDAAVKVLTLGALADGGRDRFLREQQALLRLRHPCIVDLYDAGIAEDGTPWLAMARVGGERIDAWCSAHRLDVRGRVALVLQVCDAVASAHRSLVIHRDIKPSNVLVDGDGYPRLLDFGIARLVDAQDAAEPRTSTALRALTPEYAAPEQFAGERATTAMDVYGLGALLYRLLTGQPPRRSGAGVDEPTLAPSKALSRLGAEAAAGAPERRWSRHLRGDLDTIVMKALAVDPRQRYPDVVALMDDLRRWQQRRPIRARAPGAWYRAGRFVARNRFATAASAVLVLVVAGGVAATLWQAGHARREAERAVAVKEFLVGILESGDPVQTGGRDPPASELLREGAARISTELADRPALRAELMLVIGRSQLARAALDDAVLTLDQAVALVDAGAVSDPAMQASILSERGMADYELGRYEASVRLLERARALLASARDADPAQLDLVRARLADMLLMNQRIDDALEVAGDLVAQLRAEGRTDSDSYAYALRVVGAANTAASRHAEAIDWLEQAAASERDEVALAAVENDLGIAYHDAGRIDDAERTFAKAFALQQRIYGAVHPTTMATAGNIATIHLQQGQAQAAASEFARLDRLYRERFGDSPHPDTVQNLGWQALAHYRGGDTAAAGEVAESAWGMGRGLATADASGVAWVPMLAGLLRFERGQPDPEGLLGRVELACEDLDRQRALARWTCIARAWRAAAAVGGACKVPGAKPPPDAAALEPVERRWWAAWWALQARCGKDASAAASAGAQFASLQGNGSPFPPWLAAALPPPEPSPAP